jgi:hypothetical protein
MNERQFFITYAICVLVAQIAVSIALHLLGAGDETQASVYALFLGVAGLCGGLLLLRYR